MSFSVFCLGNKTYGHYNEVGIFKDKELAKMVTNLIHELGLGNEDNINKVII